MKTYYLAPMEGLTTRIFRQAFGKYYKGVSKCFTPFLSPNQNKSFQKREFEEVRDKDELLIPTVPQLLCNNAEHFLWAAGEMASLGYKEVNFNLGCPSGTVVAKKKGSGFLSYPDELDAFFDTVFNGLVKYDMKLSVKTRLGRYLPDEFIKVLEVYNKYDFSEIIVHPRVQKDFYKEPVRPEWFEYAVKNSKNKIIYNGNLFTSDDINGFFSKYPDENTIMLGRGFIGRPFLVDDGSDFPKDIQKLKAFHDEILYAYKDRADEFSVLCKMKEMWEHMGPALSCEEGLLKKIRKARTISEYKACTDVVFNR